MVKKFKTKNRLVQPFLEKTFGEVEKLSEVSSEITFMIPKDKRNMFQEFFQSFDKRMDELGIKSYGISITTLEEVFIAVNAEDRGLNGGDATPLIIGAEENPD
jgi:ATP-binding cassette subfamily A (ABC1) protein 3